MTDHIQWLREQAGGPMSRDPECIDTCNRLAEIADEIERLRGELAAQPAGRGECDWREDSGIYDTACGECFEFTDGQSLTEQPEMKWCPFCGRRIREAANQ